MSKYPIWWDTTLTIYNRYEDAQTQLVTWYKSTIDACFWKYIGDKIAIGETVLATNNIICRIPENELFVPKYEWNEMSDADKQSHFTLGSGDIIVKGAVADIIDEYLAGSRSSDLVAKYKKLQGCMEIEEFAINTGLGRCNPHYHVKGI